MLTEAEREKDSLSREAVYKGTLAGLPKNAEACWLSFCWHNEIAMAAQVCVKLRDICKQDTPVWRNCVLTSVS
jgi:hypothetical protein